LSKAVFQTLLSEDDVKREDCFEDEYEAYNVGLRQKFGSGNMAHIPAALGAVHSVHICTEMQKRWKDVTNREEVSRYSSKRQ
jgi:hypothetical protein